MISLRENIKKLFTYSVFSTSGIVFPNTDLSAGEYHIFINNLFIIFFNKKSLFRGEHQLKWFLLI